MTAAVVLSVVDISALLGIVWVFKWVLGRWYSAHTADREDMRQFTGRAIEAMDRIAAGCASCHADMTSEIKARVGASEERVLDAVRTMATENNAATGRVILALGRKDGHVVEAIESLLISLREDLRGMRAAVTPPVGGVGSQVRDGAAP